MNLMNRRWLLRSAGAGLALGALPLARAQAPFPTSKPIRIVVATVPGSGPDVAVRQMANPLSEMLKQTVVVDNRPGANGILAANEVARAPRDGYTLLNANIGNVLNDLLRPQAGGRIGEDLLPLTDLTAGSLMLLVNPSVPARSVKELLELARANPKMLSYASGGPGCLIQLTGERVKLAANINMTEVPYKSFGADLTDLLAGHIQVGFSVWGIAGQYVRTGKLRALAVASHQRMPVASDIPTFTEEGLTGITATGWNGMFLPVGTPKDIVDKLSSAIIAAVSTPGFQQFFLKDGIEIGGKTPAQFAAFIQEEKTHYGQVIQAANIKVE
ncbi:MAG: carnitinyl-CoA dehydratase [Rhizobacter sp.]|nr:carnitinyl-CoA dehydratase [Rhizobacter sp.]